MNSSILNPDVQAFIHSHLDSDSSNLLFKKSPFKNVSVKEIVEQIESKKRCKLKIPTWFNTPSIYYPNKLNIEQTSSEITAEYKTSIIEGKTLIDLTCGLGIDSYYFSKQFKKVTSCEIDSNLASITKHNFTIFETNNIDIINNDGINHIKTSGLKFDCIYVDPSRRHDSKGKVFFLKDCSPNIPKNIDLLFKHSNTILVKASPMLDLSQGISELKHAKEVHIIAINNEVKELLFLLKQNYNQDVKIKTLNFTKESIQKFFFYKNEERKADSKFNLPQTYLYEPNNAILKSGAFNLISKKLDLYKLNINSHLYTSNQLIQFPGRSFKIVDIMNYNKKQLKSFFKNNTANVSTRNFPISVKELKKYFNIKDGGNLYVFFTTDLKNSKKVIITCKT